MATLKERIRLLVPLLAAVYLGFYGFALVMGVFGVWSDPPFTIGAAICLAILGLYALARRRGADPVDYSSPLGRQARAERERRGW